MLKPLGDIIGFTFLTPDGSVGSCKDALFDDDRWIIRYLDVDSGNWLPGRRVLLSPISLREPSWESGEIPTRLSKQEIQDSPSLANHLPVSKKWEDSFFQFHGWPYYGVGMHMWGLTHYPDEVNIKKIHEANPESRIRNDRKTHLRSFKELVDYEVSTQDGNLGSIADFLFDTRSWAIRYLVIESNQWFGGKEFIVSPSWVSHIDWEQRQCILELRHKQVKESPRPKADRSDSLDRDFERKLYHHYKKPIYWENELR